MILTHESGSQEDQFDGKKSRDTIPLKQNFVLKFKQVGLNTFEN
jgi:hypothetical protein